MMKWGYIILLAMTVSTRILNGWGWVVYDPTQAANMARQFAETAKQIEQAKTMMSYVGDPKSAGMMIAQELGSQIRPFDYNNSYNKMNATQAEDDKLYNKNKIEDNLIVGGKKSEMSRASELQAKEYNTMKSVSNDTKARRLVLEERSKKVKELTKDADQVTTQKLEVEMTAINSELNQLNAIETKASNQVLVRHAMNENKKMAEEREVDEEFSEALEKDRKRWAKMEFKRPEHY